MPGTIIDKDALILRVNVGEATNPETGDTYELTTSPGMNPLIKSRKTGKTWSINWNELIDLAIAAGVDDD